VFLSCIRNTWQAQGQHTSEFFEGSSEAVLHFNSSKTISTQEEECSFEEVKKKLMSANLEIAQLKERARKHAIEKANFKRVKAS